MKIVKNMLFILGVLMVIAAFIGRFIGNPATVANVSRTGVLLYAIAFICIAIYMKIHASCK